MDFEKVHSLKKRSEVATSLCKKYPTRVPVIVEKMENANGPPLHKNKYLVPNDISIGKFIYEIRKHMTINPEEAIFIFADNVMPPTAQLIMTLYNQRKRDDGFLYLKYSGENVFGSW